MFTDLRKDFVSEWIEVAERAPFPGSVKNFLRPRRRIGNQTQHDIRRQLFEIVEMRCVVGVEEKVHPLVCIHEQLGGKEMSDLVKEGRCGGHRMMRGVHINQRPLQRRLMSIDKEPAQRETFGSAKGSALEMHPELFANAREQGGEPNRLRLAHPLIDQPRRMVAVE